MRLSLGVLMSGVAHVVVNAQTPPGFSPSTSVKVVVSFNSDKIVPGVQIAVDIPLDVPDLYFHKDQSAAKDAPTYLVALVDPDAPYPDDPYASQYLHWLQPSIPSSSSWKIPLDTSAASAIVPYVNPTPPNTSPAHRYIVLLFQQPATFVVPAAFAGFSADNRTLFNISAFAEAADLGEPVAANWFLVSNQTKSEYC